MSYQIFQLPKTQPLAAGAILPGAKASFFLTGTSTPADVFSDEDLTTPHTQPVVADAAGLFDTIYLDSEVTYKVTITNALDVLYYTVDPVNGTALTQETIGEILYPVTSGETADGVTPLYFFYEYGDVRRYDQTLSFAGYNWFCYGQTATRANNTTFTVPGDYRTRYYITARIRLTDNAGGVFMGRIQNSTFGSGVTRIVVQTDGGGGFSGNVPVAITSLCREEGVGQQANSSFLYSAAGSGQGPLAWNRSNDANAYGEFRVFVGTASGGNNADGEPIFGADTGVVIRATHSTRASPLIGLSPVGASIVMHTGENVPICIGVNDQNRVTYQQNGSPTLMYGSSEAFGIVSPREGDSLGGAWFSFYKSAAQGGQRKGYIGFSNDGSNNALTIANEVATSNIKLESTNHVWLSKADGAAVYVDAAASTGIYTGTGSPESVVTANIGSLFLRTDGSTSTTLYVKTANNGANTGWTAK